MKRNIVFLTCLLLLASCSTTKRVQRAQEVKTDPNRQLVEQVIAVQPLFTSMQSQKARFKIDYMQHSYAVSGSVNILTDSAIVISLQPLLGIELYRMEIMPQHMTIIDKMNRRYVRLTYDELMKQTGLGIGFSDIQALLSNRMFMVGTPQEQLPSKKAEVQSGLLEHTIILTDGILNYSFRVDKQNLQLLGTMATLNGKTEQTSVRYIEHHRWNDVLFPEQIEFSFKSDKLEGTCLITFQQLSFNDKVNVTPQNLQKYTATSLSTIIR